MVKQINSVADLIDALGGPADVGRALHVGYSTVSEMKRRGTISVYRWPAFISLAQEQGICGVSPEFLLNLHVRCAPPARRNIESQKTNRSLTLLGATRAVTS